MTLAQAQQPLVFIVSGPSGSGKSTLVLKMLEVPGTMFSISCTTRPARATETGGKWYDFVSEAEFQRMVALVSDPDFVTEVAEDLPERLAHRGAVVRNQDPLAAPFRRWPGVTAACRRVGLGARGRTRAAEYDPTGPGPHG